MTSSAAIAILETSEGRNNDPTFFGLPAELRVAIHEFAFFDEAQTSFCGLAPHALTRVNRRARRESLHIYYSSVRTLEVPLYDQRNVAHVKQWLAEGYLQRFTSLPDITITIAAQCDKGTMSNTVRPVFHFLRQTVSPAQEFEREVPLQAPTRHEPDPIRAAHSAAHAHCLGLSGLSKNLGAGPTAMSKARLSLRAGHKLRFTKAIDNREVLTTRQMTVLPADRSTSSFFTTHEVYLWYAQFALRRQTGSDWGRDELEELVNYRFNRIRAGVGITPKERVLFY